MGAPPVWAGHPGTPEPSARWKAHRFPARSPTTTEEPPPSSVATEGEPWPMGDPASGSTCCQMKLMPTLACATGRATDPADTGIAASAPATPRAMAPPATPARCRTLVAKPEPVYTRPDRTELIHLLLFAQRQSAARACSQLVMGWPGLERRAGTPVVPCIGQSGAELNPNSEGQPPGVWPRNRPALGTLRHGLGSTRRGWRAIRRHDPHRATIRTADVVDDALGALGPSIRRGSRLLSKRLTSRGPGQVCWASRIEVDGLGPSRRMPAERSDIGSRGDLCCVQLIADFVDGGVGLRRRGGFNSLIGDEYENDRVRVDRNGLTVRKRVEVGVEDFAPTESADNPL